MSKFRMLFCSFFVFFASPSFADWLAVAAGDGGVWGVKVRASTKKEAEAEAMKQCALTKSKGCKLIGSSDQLGYVALAASKTYVSAQVSDTIDEAKRVALKTCAEHTTVDDRCTIEWTGINGVERDAPKADAVKNCRPKTSTVTCESKCVNGDCLLVYPNGCKMRVQVPPQFDPLNNRWEYPAPAC